MYSSVVRRVWLEPLWLNQLGPDWIGPTLSLLVRALPSEAANETVRGRKKELANLLRAFRRATPG